MRGEGMADQRILETAQDLGLGRDVRRLTRFVDGNDFVRLVNALMRVRLDHAEAEIRDVATQVRRGR